MRSSVRDVDDGELPFVPGTITIEDRAALALVSPPSVERIETTYVEMFDKQRLARYFGVSTDTIDRLVKADELRAVRIGNQVRFTLEDVEAFIERHRIRGGGGLSDRTRINVRRARRRKATGKARTREPVKEKSGLWRAMYVDLDGQVREAGRFRDQGCRTRPQPRGR